MLVLATVSIVCFNFFSKDLAKFFPDVFSGSVGFGAYVFLGTLVALLVINIVIAKVGVKVKYTETFIGGIPSEEYFEYVKQGMSTHAIRKMMAEIDANNKVELAMKAKEEADKLEAEAEKLSAEAKAAEAAGASDAGHKTQLAAQAVQRDQAAGQQNERHRDNTDFPVIEDMPPALLKRGFRRINRVDGCRECIVWGAHN